MVQARDVWDANRDGVVDAGAPSGAGITVCIIDSGIYAAHEDFVKVNIVGGYTNIVGTSFDKDMFGHGTHVAGTITAQLNNAGVVGVLPGKVSLFIVKVFGDDGAWAYSSTLVDAANRCGNAGAKIISMSLGGAQKSKLEERAFNTLYTNGVLSIAAAGNDGTTAISYPGGYASVMSVAAIDKDMVVADFSQKNSTVEIAAPGVGVLSTVPYLSENWAVVDGKTYIANHVDYSAQGDTSGQLANGLLCKTTDLVNDMTGKVVLCQRGDISFYEKVTNAVSKGAEAVIIYNNVPGNELFTLGEGNSSPKIAISVSQEDGLYLVNNKLGQVANVHSKTTIPASGYEAWDGTSMATPHVSGVAALIWSKNPSWTNVQIRNALTGSALDLGTDGRDVEYGWGLVQAYDALTYLLGSPLPTPTPTDTPTSTPTPPTPPPTQTPTPTATTPVPTETPTGTPTPNQTIYLSVETNKPEYIILETVSIYVQTLDSNQSPISAANISVKIYSPSNKLVASLTGQTNNDGNVSFTYKTRRNVGSGIYRIETTATKVGFTTVTITSTFKVQ